MTGNKFRTYNEITNRDEKKWENFLNCLKECGLPCAIAIPFFYKYKYGNGATKNDTCLL